MQDKSVFDDARECLQYEEKLSPRGSPRDGVSLDSASTVCRKLDCSSRSLSRIKKNADLNFPKSVIINGRLYWHSHEVDAWIMDRPRAELGHFRRKAGSVMPSENERAARLKGGPNVVDRQLGSVDKGENTASPFGPQDGLILGCAGLIQERSRP